jgi:hypothetical protein
MEGRKKRRSVARETLKLQGSVQVTRTLSSLKGHAHQTQGTPREVDPGVPHWSTTYNGLQSSSSSPRNFPAWEREERSGLIGLLQPSSREGRLRTQQSLSVLCHPKEWQTSPQCPAEGKTQEPPLLHIKHGDHWVPQ